MLPTTGPPTRFPTRSTRLPTSTPTMNTKTEETEEQFQTVGTSILPEEDGPDIEYVVNLPADPSDPVVITDSPTSEPTDVAVVYKHANANIVATPATSAAVHFESESEYSCTAEPCQVATWCRSRYGSCGPGFIYCNTYSTWKAWCPPVLPGTLPTWRPTPRPTREPAVTQHEIVAVPSMPSSVTPPAAPSVPHFPTLPGPTLPTITMGLASATSFVSQSSAAHADVSRPMAEKEVGVEDRVEMSEVEEGDDNGPKRKNTQIQEENYVGIDGWLAYTDRENDAPSCHSACGVYYLLSIILIFIM